MERKRIKTSLCAPIILAILFLLFLIFFWPQIKEKFIEYPPTVYPNYVLKSGGSIPSDGYMKNPAGAIDTPYFEGEFEDVILPSSLGMFSRNPDYYDYAGIYP